MKVRIPSILTGMALSALMAPSSAQEHLTLSNSGFEVAFDRRGMTSICSPRDTFRANGLENGSRFGDIEVLYKIADGDWLNIYTGGRKQRADTLLHIVEYTDYQTGMPVSMKQIFKLEDTCLDWTLQLETKMEFPMVIGDIMIPFNWNKPFDNRQIEIFEDSYSKHHFISGDGSFLYFAKPSGNPPFLVITTRQGTPLEYFSSEGRSGYRMHICSGRSGSEEQRGTWRQAHTFIKLDEAGGKASFREFGLKFHWAFSYDEIREILYREGLFDIRVVPGMSLPSDLTATFSLHTRNVIDSIVPEFPGETNLSFLGEPKPGHFIYKVSFNRLGENMLTIYYNGSEKTTLEFFSTEPLETLIKKRAAFITRHQQHRDTSKWYNGLFSVYDMRNSVLRGPDNTDGFDHWWGYVLACDDPALCKAPYVAAKNVWFPDDREIESVEYYLEHFVWGGLQRTDLEDPYPYGIHGVPNWKVSRDPVGRAGTGNYNLDKMKIWRSYDYPHVFMLYYHMYQIAKFYPEKVHYLDAAGYLERAYQTARAYWIYPYEVLPWYETYKIGCYNELVLPDIIEALEHEGEREKADFLRQEWEKKVKYFVYDDPFPYGSEYSIDRTAFESSYALAKYGVENEMQPDTDLWYDKRLEKWYSHPEVSRKESRAFMERQHYAGLAVRGWLEPKYFLLGSDFTISSDSHCMSYMAKMGGWSILDYGICYANRPWDWLQLGYASYLSSWALMNSGNEASGYGFWYPGKENDGAMGWAFMSSKYGRAWIRQDVPRGAWHYDGEADLGLGAAFRMARTVLAEDPLFGWIAYGGSLSEDRNGYSVIPRDGVRNKFSVISKEQRISVSMDRDGFAKEHPVIVSGTLDKLSFSIENRTGDTHELKLLIQTDPGRTIRLVHNNRNIARDVNGNTCVATLQLATGRNDVVVYTGF